MERCDLTGSDLSHADLSEADLSRARVQDAELAHAVLDGACLEWSRIIDANLNGVSLVGAELAGASISPLTNLTEVKWDEKYICRSERLGEFEKARAVYRSLKEWHDRAGFSRIAGEFHYREREAARKDDWKGLKLAWKQIFKPTTKDL